MCMVVWCRKWSRFGVEVPMELLQSCWFCTSIGMVFNSTLGFPGEGPEHGVCVRSAFDDAGRGWVCLGVWDDVYETKLRAAMYCRAP